MLSQVRKSVCVVLIVSTGCLPLATLHAQMMGAANSALAYNDQGDIRFDSQSSQYRYNALNQLIYDQATKSNKTINYQYYATDMQASESVTPGSSNTSSLTILYHYYAGQGQLLNSVQNDDFSGYLLAHGMALRSYQSTTNPQAQIYVRNRHSSVITMVSRKATKTQQYNAYGATILSGKSSSIKASGAYGININPLGYSNYLFDTAADIYYLKARYCTPMYRTFLSRDSYDLSNHYFYDRNNPLTMMDYSGHMSYILLSILDKMLSSIVGGFETHDSGKIISFYSFTEKDLLKRIVRIDLLYQVAEDIETKQETLGLVFSHGSEDDITFAFHSGISNNDILNLEENLTQEGYQSNSDYIIKRNRVSFYDPNLIESYLNYKGFVGADKIVFSCCKFGRGEISRFFQSWREIWAPITSTYGIHSLISRFSTRRAKWVRLSDTQDPHITHSYPLREISKDDEEQPRRKRPRIEGHSDIIQLTPEWEYESDLILLTPHVQRNLL